MTINCRKQNDYTEAIFDAIIIRVDIKSELKKEVLIVLTS